MGTVKTVSFFAGHGTGTNGIFDSGAVWGKYRESDLAMKITKAAVKYLNKVDGIKVITDAPENKINMIKQIDLSNAKRADVHVAVHLDYYKAGPGTHPLYVSEKGRELAEKLNKRVMEYTSLQTRGLVYRTDLAELNATNAPAVIFEAGSVKADAKTILREYDAIGFGLARGICDYLGIKCTAPEAVLLDQLELLEKLMLRLKFGYDGHATFTTFAKAKKHKKVNCALYISWGLQATGVLPSNRRIWLGNGVNGNGAATVKKKMIVTHPNKKPSKISWTMGAIAGWQWGSSKANKVHTAVFAGWDEGRPVWRTCGSSDLARKDLLRKRATYEKKPVKTLCKFK